VGFIGNENTKLLAELADHGDDTPRYANIAAATVKKEVNPLVLWRALYQTQKMLVQGPHSILGDLWGEGPSVARKIDKDPGASEFLYVLDEL